MTKRVWLNGLAAMCLMLAACGDDDGGTSGTGVSGSGGTGGVSGTGGVGGTSGSGGTGGVSGTGGSGGTGGVGGTGGSGGTGGISGTGGSGGTGGAYVPVGTEACCTTHESVGCLDAAVEECVCAFDERCCTQRWNDECVALARADNTTANCGSCKGSCCTSKTTPGCDDPVVEACVCDEGGETTCCTTAWDLFCADILTETTLCGTSCQ